jgi:hypothetical protein
MQNRVSRKDTFGEMPQPAVPKWGVVIPHKKAHCMNNPQFWTSATRFWSETACRRHQLTLLSAVRAFGDLIPPFIITKNKIFQTNRLARQQFYASHDYKIRSAPKTFVIDVLFIDWSQSILLTWNTNLIREFSSLLIILADAWFPFKCYPSVTPVGFAQRFTIDE